MDQALIASQNTISHGPFVIHPSILVIPFPCSAQGKAWPSASSLPSRSSSTPCDCRRGGSPRFPGQRRSQVVHALPSELATCLTPVYVSLSSPYPSSVSPWTTHEAARARRPILRVSSHGFQIHHTRSSFTFLAPFPTPQNLAPGPISSGIRGSSAASH